MAAKQLKSLVELFRHLGCIIGRTNEASSEAAETLFRKSCTLLQI